MAKVHITNIVVLDNPSSFLNPFQFELTFECIEELKEDLEWKMIYVGSAESEIHDQILDTIYVGPVPEGRHIFVFQADPPDVNRIPEQDVVGVTIVLLTCSYRGQEFVRVGYFINNDYADPELREMPPAKPQFEKLTRNILESKPRVTRFKINWDDVQQQQQQNGSTSTTQLDSLFGGSESQSQQSTTPQSFATGIENTANNEMLSAADDNSTMNCIKTQQSTTNHNNNGVMMMMDQHFNTNMDDDSQMMMSSNNNNNKTISSCDPRINENSNSLAMEC